MARELSEFRKVKNVEGWGGWDHRTITSQQQRWVRVGAVSQGLREKSHCEKASFILCPSGSWGSRAIGAGTLTAPEQSPVKVTCSLDPEGGGFLLLELQDGASLEFHWPKAVPG